MCPHNLWNSRYKKPPTGSTVFSDYLSVSYDYAFFESLETLEQYVKSVQI